MAANRPQAEQGNEGRHRSRRREVEDRARCSSLMTAVRLAYILPRTIGHFADWLSQMMSLERASEDSLARKGPEDEEAV